MSPSLRSMVGVATTIAVVLAFWVLLGPRSLGGPMSYALPDGISMQPHLRRGDLVLIRSAKSYPVGEVVAYDSHLLHRIVLHRIVGRDGNRYVFRGDNNSFEDPERPLPNQLVGRQWLVIPGVGRYLAALQYPPILAALAALIGFLAAGGLGAFGPEAREVAAPRGA